MLPRNFRMRVARLEARVGDDTAPQYVELNSQKPGGATSVRGPDGRRVWWNPPAGYKVGGFLDEIPLGKMFIVGVETRGGPDAEPTTAMGPNGRLVWLDPPEGCKAGEPIEDAAMDMSSSEIVRARAALWQEEQYRHVNQKTK
jgi:hypothetical protein